jgi:hypothetical protein
VLLHPKKKCALSASCLIKTNVSSFPCEVTLAVFSHGEEEKEEGPHCKSE